jgi:hypothetical protein
MESVGASVYSLFINETNLYIKDGVTEIPGTRITFSTLTADLFVNTAGHQYYAAVSASTLHLYQNGAFKGPLTLLVALSGTHSKVATVVIGTDQYVLYTDDAGRLQVISYKTTADTAAPVNSSGFPRVTGVNASGFTVEATVDESASIFYVAVDNGSTAPTSAEVIAGANYGGVTVWAAGNFAVLPNSMNSRAVTGLTAGTEYDVYVVARDREGNSSSPVLIDVTTVTVVNIPAIGGVTAPVTGATPVAAITETAQYTGTVSWSPALAADGTFAPGTAYAATITLTAKPGFTFTGVAANSFTVAGATSVTNSADTGVVTAVFPATAPIPVTPPAPPVTPPVPPVPAPTVVEWPVIVRQTTIGEIEDVVVVTVTPGAITGEAPKIVAQVMPDAAAAPLVVAATGVGLTVASEVVGLTMTGGEFTAPVQLTLTFDVAKVAAGQVPSVFVYNERTRRWIYLGGQVGVGTITVTVDRFSNFAVFATRPLPALADITDHWGRGSVRTLAGMGIVSGFPDGNFKPSAGVTRAEFVSMLTRALGLTAKPEAAARFTDADRWARGAIGAAAEAGLIAGYADGTFGGSRRITRAEMAVILQRVIRKGLVLVIWTAGTDFADAKDFPAWAADGIRTASTAGLVQGFRDRNFWPGSAATRAEAVTMLYRLVAER